MTTAPAPAPESSPVPVAAAPVASEPSPPGGWLLVASALVAVAGLVACLLLWQKVTSMQEQLARQSGDAIGQAEMARQ